jgi:hypothetical protein
VATPSSLESDPRGSQWFRPHDHVFLPSVTDLQAHTAIQAMGLVAQFLLDRLAALE